ncbi:restriction endonuclease subunit S [Chryseobacterium suipulveris]|uniref:Restriction endonuclease subunit S n=1 Tax=Chryseobacterium suipulveris TaxID=2929800 RepID=A0ABY4BLS0_9FLAO|nr:restriction endonuclease subunit S [Chryseobacterium suipulveris]UOE40137.1 restriction endonuclease subunit S [Chryseobacterium suipulveris]
MVYNNVLKREIPEGWEVNTVGEFSNVKKGTLITEKNAKTNGSVKVVSAGIGFSYFHDKSNFPANTITVSASGANAGFVNFWREPIFACDCTTIRGENDYATFYILQFLKSVQEFIYSQAHGSAQPHVYPKDIENLEIVLPTKKILEQFGKAIIQMNDKITNDQQQNQQLTQLRDWLLPMLMNGQVTVK